MRGRNDNALEIQSQYRSLTSTPLNQHREDAEIVSNTLSPQQNRAPDSYVPVHYAQRQVLRQHQILRTVR